MAGADSVRPTEVALDEASSSNSYNGTLKEVALGLFMATINSVPAGEFVVRVAGKNVFSKPSNGLFQRRSSTKLQASNVTITVSFTELWSNIVLYNMQRCKQYRETVLKYKFGDVSKTYSIKKIL
ncbi:hypothetical protein AOLI_G00017480 [Acnodon oligacanthus]